MPYRRAGLVSGCALAGLHCMSKSNEKVSKHLKNKVSKWPKKRVSKWPKNEVSKQSVCLGSETPNIQHKKHSCIDKCIFGHFKTVAYYEFRNTIPFFVTIMQQKRRRNTWEVFSLGSARPYIYLCVCLYAPL